MTLQILGDCRGKYLLVYFGWSLCIPLHANEHMSAPRNSIIFPSPL